MLEAGARRRASPPPAGTRCSAASCRRPAAPLLIAALRLRPRASVISASHNPFHDNGIKFFGADGDKLSDATEAEIEARTWRAEPAADADVGRVRALHGDARGLPARRCTSASPAST